MPVGYYDRYTRAKGWKKVLYRPGYAVQSAELNEIHSIIVDEMRQLGTTIFKEGAVLSGCELQVDLNIPNVTITAGKIYFQGVVHDLPGGTIAITAVGEEIIGIQAEEHVITESEDPDLLDPAESYSNFGFPGAHRLSYTYNYVKNTFPCIIIGKLFDGQITSTTNVIPFYDDLYAILAQRTYEESGSYTVRPFNIEVKDLETTNVLYDTKMRLAVRDGLAYVNGWRIDSSSLTTMFDRPLDAYDVLDEYMESYSTNKAYTLAETPIKHIDSLNAVVEVDIDMIRGGTGDGRDDVEDQFPSYVPLVSIEHIDGYSSPADYIKTGNNIDWSPGGSEPGAGATYHALIHYSKQMVKQIMVRTYEDDESVTHGSGATDTLTHTMLNSITDIWKGSTHYVENTDYTYNGRTGVITWLSGHGPNENDIYHVEYYYWAIDTAGDFICKDSFRDGSGNILYDDCPTYSPTIATVDYKTQVVFDTAGDKPVVGTAPSISYGYFVPRIDVVALASNGVLSVIKGTGSPHPAAASIPAGVMGIARLEMTAEARASGVTVTMFDNRRSTMEDIRTLIKQVKAILYNDAVFQLQQEVLNNPIAPITDKKGIMADNFKDTDGGDPEADDWKASYDLIGGLIYLGQVQENLNLVVDSGNTTAVLNGDYYVNPHTTDVAVITQPFATTSNVVNQFAYMALGGRIVCDPRVDNWLDENIVIIRKDVSVQAAQAQAAWLRSQALGGQIPFFTSSSVRNIQLLVAQASDRVSQIAGQLIPNTLWNDPIGNLRGWSTTPVPHSWEEIAENIKVEAVPWARQISVTVSGKHFHSEEDNIKVYFDDEQLYFTDAGKGTPGTANGSMKADVNGEFEATFTVPAGTRTGIHGVRCQGDNTVAFCSYYAYHFHRTITREITLTTVVPPTTHGPSPDPLAQTFSVDQACFLSKIDIYFKTKSSTLPVEVCIVEVDNGFPTSTILGSARLEPASVNISSNSATATTFTFEHPVYVSANTEYAFVIKTDTDEYELFISELGGIDILTSKPVYTNSYTGVMLESANALTWSPRQKCDIKFILYRANFSTSSIVKFNKTDFEGGVPKSRIMLNSSSIAISAACKTQWQYSLDNTSWIDFSPFNEVDLGSTKTGMWFRCVLTGDTYLTPVIHDSALIHACSWETSGAYVAREFILDDDCQYIDLWVDANVPGGTSITPKVTFNGGTSWTTIPWSADKVLDATFTEKYYVLNLGSASQHHIKVAVFMTGTAAISPACKRLRVSCRIVS